MFVCSKSVVCLYVMFICGVHICLYEVCACVCDMHTWRTCEGFMCVYVRFAHMVCGTCPLVRGAYMLATCPSVKYVCVVWMHGRA